MKKERNCAMDSGMYPTYQGMMPMMPQMMQPMSSQMIQPMTSQMMQPMSSQMINGISTSNYGGISSYDQQMDSINNRLSNLERRVLKLENTNPKVTPLNTYNDTNYYMM